MSLHSFAHRGYILTMLCVFPQSAMMSPARRMLLHCLLIVAVYADSPVAQRPTSPARVNTDARPAVVNDEHGPGLFPDAKAAKATGSPLPQIRVHQHRYVISIRTPSMAMTTAVLPLEAKTTIPSVSLINL